MKRALLITAVLCLLLPAAAEAGTYQVQSCNNGDHSGSTVWNAYNNNGNYRQSWGGCPYSGGGMTWNWNPGPDAPGGATAGFYLDAPSGTSFNYLYWQQMLTSQGGGARCVLATTQEGNMISDSNCITNTFGSESTGWVTKQGGLSSSRIYLNVACIYGPCTGGANNKIIGYFGYANANIADGTSPGLYDLGGIWGRSWVRGSWPLSWNASDSMGVKIHAFQVDGAQQAGNQFCSPGQFGAGYYYGSSLQPCPNPGNGGYQSASFTVNTAAYSNGTHTLSAVSYDSTDNAGVANMTLYVDNSTPSTPTFTSGPSNGAWINDPTPTFAFTSSDPQSGIGGYRCQVDSGSFYNCSSPTTLAAQSEGSHQLCVQSFNNALDSSGNPAYSALGCTTFKVDTAPPSAFLNPAPQYIAASGTTLSGSASDPTAGIAQVQFQARPQSGGSWQTLCTRTGPSPYSCPVNGSALDNNTTYELRLLATNNASTSAASSIETSLVDNQPPSAPSINSGPANNSWVKSSSATYSFSSTDPVSGVAYYQCNQGSWKSCVSPKTFSGLSSGMNNLSFRAVDNAGNISSQTDRSVGSDLIDPVLTLDSLPVDVSGTITVSGTATDTLSGVDSSSITLEIRSLPSGSFSDICNPPSKSGDSYSCSLDTTTLPDGDYQIEMTGQDNVGNQPSSWPSETITIDNAGPSITLDTQDRISIWTVTDTVSGIDSTGFTAEFSDDAGSSWQAMDDPYWNPLDNQFRAAIPDSVPGNTTVEVRLEATSKSGATSTDTSSPFTLPLEPPVNTSRPTVSGSDRDGEQLTTTSGDWTGLATITYQYYWLRCSLSGDDCVLRSTTSSDQTTLADGDVNHTIRSMVVATNPDGANSEDSEPTAVIEALPPAPLAPPLLSGTAKQGETLTADNGSWSGSQPFDYSYQWQRCNSGNCQNISGADEAQYTATNSDVAKTLRVEVTASNSSLPGGGESSQVSSETSPVEAIVPSGDGLPTISGQPYSSVSLVASTGSWSGSEPFQFSYQWLSCDSSGNNCSDISGADEANYIVPADEIGATIRVRVTADNSSLPGGGSAEQTSEASAVIADGNPSNSSPPTISGTAQEGDQLEVDPGSWQGLPPISFSYQWQRCQGGSCQNIEGATAQAYVAEFADVGYTLRAQITASNSASSTTVYSPETAAVVETPDPPRPTTLPEISGSAAIGQTLSASEGSWSGRTPISFAYQWQRCDNSSCANIPLATTSSYTVSGDDARYRLRVEVTASNIDGSDSVASASSAIVAPLVPANEVAPSISGGIDDGDRLTANPGQWIGQGDISYQYIWQRCQASCSEVGRGPSYDVTDGDVGSSIKLIVEASSAFGTSKAESALHGPIVQQEIRPADVKRPEISGTAEVGQELQASSGQWQSKTNLTYGYSWQRCNSSDVDSCSSIAGANQARYSVTNSDFSKYLRVIVTATNEAGTSAQVSDATAKVAAPVCLKAQAVKSGSFRLLGRRVSFSGSRAGYYGKDKWLRLQARSSRSGLRLAWTLSGRKLSQTRNRSSRLTLSNSKLLLGKQKLVLTASRGKKIKSLSRTVTTSACPSAKKINPKPRPRNLRRNQATISQTYSVLNPGRWRLSGPKPQSLRWRLDGKKFSSKRSVSVSPTRLSAGPHKISLTIKRSGRTRTVSWQVKVENYPNK